MSAALLVGAGMVAGIVIFALGWVLAQMLWKASTLYRAISERDHVRVVVRLQDWRTK